MRIGIIGGTGFYDAIKGNKIIYDTRFGRIHLVEGELDGIKVIFANRHSVDGKHKILPHEVNYRGIIEVIKHQGVSRIFGIGAVGGMMPYMEVGEIYLPVDVIDLTHGRPTSFFGLETGDAGHLICENLFCPELQKILTEELGYIINPGGHPQIYVCTNGPRLETPAEIGHFRSIGGTLVGMTLMPEAALAAELGMCYVPINVVVNPAAGIRPGFNIELDEIKKAMAGAQAGITRAIVSTVRKISEIRSCGCGDRVIHM
jgi:purine nucleoside phosphorylase